jgi:hypothetical protein
LRFSWQALAIASSEAPVRHSRSNVARLSGVHQPRRCFARFFRSRTPWPSLARSRAFAAAIASAMSCRSLSGALFPRLISVTTAMS